MLLARRLKFGLSFNILNAFKNVKEAFTAPRKHWKSLMEPSGSEYSTQLNLTAEGFDEVSAEWQAHFAGNPFDLQTYNYLEGVQLANFGTVDNPNVIFTADAPFRIVGCSGPTNEDDYESHELMWMLLREGPLQRCTYCGQVFKLVRLRNEFSSEMDYYATNFNQLPFQDMPESEIPNTISLHKANTHYEPSLFEQPENTIYSFVSSDQHDRILTDPAYRMQRKAEADMKAKIYLMAMQDYQNDKILNSPWRQPIGKVTYQNLITAQAVLRKLDRQFRKLTKFHSRYPPRHAESTSTRPTTAGGRKGCWTGPTRDGTTPTPSSPTTSPKKNSATGTTSKPTCRTTGKTNGSRRYHSTYPVFGQTGTSG